MGKGTSNAHGWRALALTVILAAAAFCSSACKTYSSRETSDPSRSVARLQAGGTVQAEVDRLAEPLIHSGKAYGLAVGVLGPGGLALTGGYGRTGRAGDDQPPGPDTIFGVGSLAKLFVAALLDMLVKEGQLGYQDTVRGIFPPGTPLSPDIAELTLHELVTHTGGLPRQPSEHIQLFFFIRFLFTGENLYGYITKPYLYEYLKKCRLKPRADRKYEYSNIGAALLAHLIEVKAKRSIPDLVAQKITGPLNMRDTAFSLTPEQQTRLAVGHVGDQPKFMRRNTPLAAWDMGEIMRPSGGLYSTVNDLMIFARANLGLLGSPLDRQLAATHRVQLRTPAEDVALGWLLSYFDQGREVITYKHGMVSGYSAYIGLDCERPLAVIVLYNNFLWRDKVGHNLILRLANGLNAHSAKPPSELRQAAGQTNDPLNETQAADQREAGGALAGGKSH